MKKKVLGTLLSVAMVASMLVGCGGGEAETAAPAATEGTPAADAEETPAADAPAADAEEAPAADAPAATGGKKVGVAMPTQSSERWINDMYLIHIRRCRRLLTCRYRWSPNH